jgi:hypothetical protein
VCRATSPGPLTSKTSAVHGGEHILPVLGKDGTDKGFHCQGPPLNSFSAVPARYSAADGALRQSRRFVNLDLPPAVLRFHIVSHRLRGLF